MSADLKKKISYASSGKYIIDFDHISVMNQLVIISLKITILFRFTLVCSTYESET